MTEILLTTNFSFKACTEPNSFELCRAVEKSTKLIERIKRILFTNTDGTDLTDS